MLACLGLWEAEKCALRLVSGAAQRSAHSVLLTKVCHVRIFLAGSHLQVHLCHRRQPRHEAAAAPRRTVPSSTSIAYRRERMPRPLSVRSSSAPIACAHAAATPAARQHCAKLLSARARKHKTPAWLDTALGALRGGQPQLHSSLGNRTTRTCLPSACAALSEPPPGGNNMC